MRPPEVIESKGAEALGAFVLMWAVMGTAVNPAAVKGVDGIAIGGALGVGVLISGSLTDFWLYILGPIIGAVAAALLYRTVMELDERPLPAQSPVRGESAEPPLAAAR